MEAIQLIQIPKEELMQDFEQVVYKVLEKLKFNNKPQEKELYTRQETANLLGVSLTTLFHWNNQGVLKSIKKGRKVYYSKKDVFNHLDC
jgi:excisionase family DNA binding protein